jgi:hypothetical protein
MSRFVLRRFFGPEPQLGRMPPAAVASHEGPEDENRKPDNGDRGGEAAPASAVRESGVVLTESCLCDIRAKVAWSVAFNYYICGI